MVLDIGNTLGQPALFGMCKAGCGKVRGRVVVDVGASHWPCVEGVREAWLVHVSQVPVSQVAIPK